MNDTIDDGDIANALDRIAMTPDGALLYAFLQKVAIARLPGDPSDGALRAEHGRRSLAHDLMSKMARGIDESAGRTADSDRHGRPSERPVVFLASKPVIANRKRGAGRRVGPDDTVAGWDSPAAARTS
jgi:hypothetical protein